MQGILYFLHKGVEMNSPNGNGQAFDKQIHHHGFTASDPAP
jgi:hypothetical protein